jgi:hypothetical protein
MMILIWASRFALPSVALASGYPLHHPRRRFASVRVVPLLSLSHFSRFSTTFI